MNAPHIAFVVSSVIHDARGLVVSAIFIFYSGQHIAFVMSSLINVACGLVVSVCALTLLLKCLHY